MSNQYFFCLRNLKKSCKALCGDRTSPRFIPSSRGWRETELCGNGLCARPACCGPPAGSHFVPSRLRPAHGRGVRVGTSEGDLGAWLSRGHCFFLASGVFSHVEGSLLAQHSGFLLLPHFLAEEEVTLGKKLRLQSPGTPSAWEPACLQRVQVCPAPCPLPAAGILGARPPHREVCPDLTQSATGWVALLEPRLLFGSHLFAGIVSHILQGRHCWSRR